MFFFFFSSRRRHTRSLRDWSSDVCSSDLEAFGHLSEADFVYENPQAREMMTLGRRFGKPVLNVGDNGAASGLRGTLPFDDEGTPTQDTTLIKDGILVGRLHSREKIGRAHV